MEQIRTKPANKKYRANYDRIFKKRGLLDIDSSLLGNMKNVDGNGFKSAFKKPVPLGDRGDSFQNVYVTDDPHFGG